MSAAGSDRLFIDLDSRIDQGISQIDKQVQSQQEDGIDHDCAKDEGLVAVFHAVDEVLTEAGDVEDVFDHKRSSQRRGGGGAEIGEDRQHGISETVPPDDGRIG